MEKSEKQETLTGSKRVCVKLDAEQMHKGFLSGCYIYLHPASLSKSRKALFEKQIASNGGNLVLAHSCPKDIKRLVILIDDNLIDNERICQMIEKILESSTDNQEW